MFSRPKLKMSLGTIVVSCVMMLTNTSLGAPSDPSIVDIALQVNGDSGEFSTLIAALGRAELVSTLDGNRQFTVFAPIDAAFSDIGIDADSIQDVPVDELTDILLNHVSPGRRLSGDILASDRVRMLNKSFTIPSITDAGAFIDDAQLLAPDLIDIEARNGVIHVIDSVLGIPSMTASAQAVPEPASFSLFLIGLLTCVGLRRRSRPSIG